MNTPLAHRPPSLNWIKKLLFLICGAIAIACGGSGGGFFGSDPISVRATPETLSMRPGETKTVRLEFFPGEDGTHAIRANAPNLSVSPANFNVEFNGPASVVQDVEITAATSTSLGEYTLSIGTQLEVYRTVPITVTDGVPDFVITASPEVVSVPPNTMSNNVVFTVSSRNGFSGPVKVTWVADGGATPSPNDNDFTGTVTPSAPFRFTRKMYRFATHSVDIPISFNVTDVPFTKQRSVTVTVKQQ